MNKPNLFEIGTKELAQDAFLTWLISYADNQYIEHKELNTLAKDFIKMMVGNNNLNIEKVYCWRQWEKIDISVTVNDKYFIIIEDKTGTNQHGNQLANYKVKAQDHCNKNNLELVCVFLKTRDDSTYIVNSIERENYKYISRNDLLSLFETLKSIIEENVSVALPFCFANSETVVPCAFAIFDKVSPA